MEHLNLTEHVYLFGLGSSFWGRVGAGILLWGKVGVGMILMFIAESHLKCFEEQIFNGNYL